jgi:hypothetical protein
VGAAKHAKQEERSEAARLAAEKALFQATRVSANNAPSKEPGEGSAADDAAEKVELVGLHVPYVFLLRRARR